MDDLGHKWTEEELAALERRIRKVYKDARDDLQGKVDKYFALFVERDKKQQELLKDGKITEEQYKQWRLAQIGRGKRFEALRDQVAERMTEANKVAVSYVNDVTPGIYSLNHNYAAYTIEQVSGDVGFTIWDEQTVKRLIAEEPTLLPERRVDAPKDLKWNKRQFTAEITAGILQGEAIGKIANRVQNLSDANRSGALRNARTAVTGAQNAGRQESYNQAKKMGLQLRKRWIATKDGRTRHAHAMLDGQTVELDEPFKIESSELMFPGDPTGRANLVWNCRCTMRTVEKEGIEAEPRQMRVRDSVTGSNVLVNEMTYQEWFNWKSSFTKEQDGAKIIYGAISGALFPESEEADAHAKRYYESVRKMKTDVKRISQNTQYSEEQINKVKNFVFIDEHELEPGIYGRFEPSYEMAESWQRLIDGKNIQRHDITLLEHELMENGLMEQGYSQEKAHIMATIKHNYAREAAEHYGRVKKHKSKQG